MIKMYDSELNEMYYKCGGDELVEAIREVINLNQIKKALKMDWIEAIL